MLTEAQLAAMRSTQVLAQPSTATISRPTFSSDGAGGSTATWADATKTTVRVSNPTGLEYELAAKLQVEGAITLTLPQGTLVTVSDKVLVGARSFDILAVLVGDYATATRVLAKEKP